MTPTMQLLTQARARHRAGDHAGAEQLSRQLVEAQPDHADGWRLLGEALHGQRRFDDAAAAFRQALRLHPESADDHFRLARLLGEQAQWEEALVHYRRALAGRPGHPETLNDLGVALAGRGQLDEAADSFRQALQARPDLAEAHRNLGSLLLKQGKEEEAIPCLEEALRLNPADAEACVSLGNALRKRKRLDEAVARYRRALELRPDLGEAYAYLGHALGELRRPAEAVVFLRQAARLLPSAPKVFNDLGLALVDLGRYGEAEDCYHQALRLNPALVDAHNNLGVAYRKQGRLTEALASFDVALWHAPASVETRANRSMVLLQQGDFARGWPEYEWRWQFKDHAPPVFPQPRWDGSDLQGRTVLLWFEQGLGDILQFARYAPLVRGRGGRVVLAVPNRLVPLLRTCPGVDQVAPKSEPLPPFDVQLPLLSVPGVLGTTLESIPAEVPYLSAEPDRVERWRGELQGLDGLRVGVAWQGSPGYAEDASRSVPLKHFAPLAGVPGVRLVSLQKGAGVEQLPAVERKWPVKVLGPELDADGAFLDTAAVLQHLDLVVCSDTSVAHLAGALGVPVWVALSTVADWRWLCEREDSPWYPTMRLFRQRHFGDWADVFERLAGEVAALVGGRPAVRG